MTTDTLFVIGLMTVVGVVWDALALPKLRKRLPKIHLIARSWWWMLAGLYSCYMLAKITQDGQYPYQWLLIGFFILIGLRGSYEISRLWRLESKARLIRKLQARGLQAKTVTIPYPRKSAIGSQVNAYNSYYIYCNKQPANNSQTYAYLNALDIIFSFAFVLLIISLISLQQLAWQRGHYGILLFVLFASQFNDIAQFLGGKLFKDKLFKRGLAPRISPNKSIEGALFGSMYARCFTRIPIKYLAHAV